MNPLLKRALTACILLYLALNPANARSGGMRWGAFLLDSLDKEIAKREAYAMQRDRRISELSGMLNSGSGLSDELRYSLNDRLYQEYYGYKCDSVLSYLNSNVTLAKKMGNASYENSKLLRLCFVCASSGMYLESKENLDAVRRGAMERDTALLEDYYFNFVNLYNEMALYSQDKAQTVIYKSIHDTYLDSLRKILAPGSNREIYYREEDMKWKGDYDSALVLNSLRMGRCDINTPAYSVVCFQRGLIYEMEGDSLNSLRFMGGTSATVSHWEELWGSRSYFSDQYNNADISLNGGNNGGLRGQGESKSDWTIMRKLTSTSTNLAKQPPMSTRSASAPN